VGTNPQRVQLAHQAGIINISVTKGLRPDSVLRLSQMKLANTGAIELDHIEQRDLRISRTALNPMGIQT